MRTQTIVAGFVSVFLFSPIFWMLFDRVPPYMRTSGSIEPPDPLPGSQITVTWTIAEVRYCPREHTRMTTRMIIDAKGIEHRYAPTVADYKEQNPTEIMRNVQLPPNITPGQATYHSQTCYACNPFQEMWPVCVSTPDIKFTIAPANQFIQE